MFGTGNGVAIKGVRMGDFMLVSDIIFVRLSKGITLIYVEDFLLENTLQI